MLRQRASKRIAWRWLAGPRQGRYHSGQEELDARPVFVQPWPWWGAGIGIGLVVVALAALASRPLSVTTGFGSVCALASDLPYFKRSEFGRASRWRLEFLAAVLCGAALSALGSGHFGKLDAMGSLALVVAVPGRVALLAAGGICIGFGARMANGCTSGHSIMGTALLAPASFVATAMFMGGGALAVFVLYGALGLS